MIHMNEAEFQMRLNEAATAGAMLALSNVGLSSEEDIDNLREALILGGTIRGMRDEFTRTLSRWFAIAFVTGLVALLGVGTMKAGHNIHIGRIIE